MADNFILEVLICVGMDQIVYLMKASIIHKIWIKVFYSIDSQLDKTW